MKSFDTNVTIATTSSPKTLLFTGIGLIVIPISTVTACVLSIGNTVIYETYLQNYKNTKNNMRKINKLLKLLINYTENPYKIM